MTSILVIPRSYFGERGLEPLPLLFHSIIQFFPMSASVRSWLDVITLDVDEFSDGGFSLAGTLPMGQRFEVWCYTLGYLPVEWVIRVVSRETTVEPAPPRCA
jgi:hypothetical protein